MKKKGLINFFWLALLVGLLIFTYYYEELHFFESTSDASPKIDLAQDVKSIQVIRLKNSTIINTGKYEVESPRYRADDEMINSLLTSFAHFKVKRKLGVDEINSIVKNSQESLFFNVTPFFVDLELLKTDGSKQRELYVWGNYLGKDLGNYIKRTVNGVTEWLLVSDESPMNGLYYANDDVNLVKYEKLKSLLIARPNDYFAKKILVDLSFENLSSIELSSLRNKKFKIDLVNQKTIPEKFSVLTYNQALFTNFITAIQNLEQQEILFANESKKLKELAVLELMFKDGTKKILNLKSEIVKEQEQLYLTMDKLTFKIKPTDKTLFFLHEQDFWNKTLLTPEELKVSDNKLLSLVKNEAAFVRLSDEEKLPPKSQIGKLKIKDNSLTFYDIHGEIIVSHLEKKLNYHFKRN